MIRKLCFFLLGAVLLCGTTNANVIVDNFAFGAQIGVALDDVNLGGTNVPPFTSDLSLNQSDPIVAPLYDSASDSYFPDPMAPTPGVPGGEDFSVTYSDFAAMGSTLGAASGMGPFISLIVPVSTDQLGEWNLEVGGIVNGVYYSAPVAASGDQIIPVAGLGLENDTTLTLTFTYNGQGSGNLTYGGSGELLEATVAPVPEPTTLMMFGTVVGLGLVNRRRRK